MLSFFFIYFLSLFAASLGNVGMIAFSLLNPFLMAGFYHLAFKADNGVNSEFMELFTAFSDVRVRGVLLQIGFIGLLYTFFFSQISTEAAEQFIDGKEVNGEALITLVFASILYQMFFFFAVPVAYFFHERSLLFVIKYAFLACLSNPLALTLFGLLAFLLSMATIFTLFLAMIVVSPMLMISVYLAFNDILKPEFEIEHKADDNDDDQGSGPDFKIEA